MAKKRRAAGGEALGDTAVGHEVATIVSTGNGDHAVEAPPGETGKRWYVVHTYTGFEDRVKRNLEQRIKSMDASNKVFQVVVPTENEIEVRGGQRRTVEKRIFPGYVLIEMLMDDKAWAVVRNTPGVTGFVGSGSKPTPLSEEEIATIRKRMEAAVPRIKVGFSRGETVRLKEGPFADFVGVIDEIYAQKGRAKVLVSFFGRETPVELDLLQLERI